MCWEPNVIDQPPNWNTNCICFNYIVRIKSSIIKSKLRNSDEPIKLNTFFLSR